MTAAHVPARRLLRPNVAMVAAGNGIQTIGATIDPDPLRAQMRTKVPPRWFACKGGEPLRSFARFFLNTKGTKRSLPACRRHYRRWRFESVAATP